MGKFYHFKINNELKKIFEEYIKRFNPFGYKNIGEFLNEIIRVEAKKILQEHPELDRYVKLSKSEYVLASALQDYYKDGLKEGTTYLLKLSRKEGVVSLDEKKPMTLEEFKEKYLKKEDE